MRNIIVLMGVYFTSKYVTDNSSNENERGDLCYRKLLGLILL